MIPKIIHYCWLSNDPVPAQLQRCIDTWKPLLPDYEIWLWDFERLGDDLNDWVREAFNAKKYAFAADYVRAYALYNYGGIYMDSDVELLKSFDPFLHLPYMMCRESGTDSIEAACIGAEKGHPFFKALVEYYHDRHFVRSDGSFEDTPMPYIFIATAKKNALTIKDIPTPEYFDADPNTLSVLPSYYFSPINLETMQMDLAPQTVAIHRFAATWRTPAHRAKKRFQRLIGPTLTTICIRIKKIVKSLCLPTR
ncbi:MAG: glycosyl transferase [Muribaculaceae bacterium]|nr:glycosyl transferase [Muribaculaceae bacterium]